MAPLATVWLVMPIAPDRPGPVGEKLGVRPTVPPVKPACVPFAFATPRPSIEMAASMLAFNVPPGTVLIDVCTSPSMR